MGRFNGSDVGSSNVSRDLGSNNVDIDTGDFKGNVVGEIVTTKAKLGALLGGAVIGDFEGSSNGILNGGDVTRISPDVGTLVTGAMLGNLLEEAIVVIIGDFDGDSDDGAFVVGGSNVVTQIVVAGIGGDFSSGVGYIVGSEDVITALALEGAFVRVLLGILVGGEGELGTGLVPGWYRYVQF